MNDRIPRSQGDHVLVDVKAKPSGGLRPALTPTPGAVRWQRAGRRPKGDPQIQVSTVSGDCRFSCSTSAPSFNSSMARAPSVRACVGRSC
jgi:hypothetical protein